MVKARTVNGKQEVMNKKTTYGQTEYRTEAEKCDMCNMSILFHTYSRNKDREKQLDLSKNIKYQLGSLKQAMMKSW